LADPRAQAYALGTLGGVYEQTQQWSQAQDLTQQALLLAEGIEAPDIAYRWQWQLGRILKAPGNPQANTQAAIAAYTKAVNILKSLRSDLVAINPEVQFSFRDSVEPVYRELVSMLLQSGGNQPSQDNLKQARDVIESLQVAQLDNFFRLACLNAQPVDIDQIDKTAAVIYPIILADRLEVILSLPNHSLRHYATRIPQHQVEYTIEQLRQKIVTRTSQEFLPISQQVYSWLIRPLESELENSQVKNLVFVLDGSLRNIPMAALHDGQHYLLEKYNIALTPGLQLLTPQPLARGRLRTLVAGITASRQGFSALPGVQVELNKIKSEVPTRELLNQQFTTTALEDEVKSFSAPVVHLATHVQFASKVENTFILTWDSRVNVNELNAILQNREINNSGAVELLVLSACKTATGDKDAALGLAGLAIRSGARSTLATLWVVSDEATTAVMGQFYKDLADTKVTKAEALRRAQLTLLKNPTFKHPYFWAPYVLVGNWL
jgi:CHAT domain-containing protein